MNTKYFSYLLAIAETGSLSNASRQANVSQSLLSKFLMNMERDVGLSLFEKEGGRYVPTKAGLIVLETGKKILELETRTKNSIYSLDPTANHTIHIGVSPHRGASTLAAIIPEFIKRFPNHKLVPLEGYAPQLRNYIIDGDVNYALSTWYEEKHPQIKYFPLYDEELFLCVPKHHSMAKLALQKNEGDHPTIDLRHFRDTPFVTMGKGTTVGEMTQSLFKAAGFKPTIIYSSNNVQMIAEMLKTGIGVGLLPHFYAKNSDAFVPFRLLEPAYLNFGVLTTAERSFTKEERCLIYLQLANDLKNPIYKVHMSPDLESIIHEFDTKNGPYSSYYI